MRKEREVKDREEGDIRRVKRRERSDRSEWKGERRRGGIGRWRVSTKEGGRGKEEGSGEREG